MAGGDGRGQRELSIRGVGLVGVDIQVLIIRSRGQETSGSGPAATALARIDNTSSPTPPGRCDHNQKGSKASHIPESIHTAQMTTQFIDDVQIVDPFLGAVNAAERGRWRLVPAFSAPETIVQRVFHDCEVTRGIAKTEALTREDRRPSWTHGCFGGVAGTAFSFSLVLGRLSVEWNPVKLEMTSGTQRAGINDESG